MTTRPDSRRRRWAVPALMSFLLAAAFAGGLLPSEGAQGQDRNFAGSIQASYLYVPTDPEARDVAFDGFVTELGLKLAVDFSDHVSANVKVCYGCHGFEIGMAFVDMRVTDELNIRVGRFNPSFGEFQLRHDPANHRTVDKPLPYDMGRMLRLREWNMGIIPAPYVDNGVEINGSHWFGTLLQVDYAFYVVGGFRGNQDAVDVDWIQSRNDAFYYVDNNSVPAAGGRLAFTLDLSVDVALTLGGSVMHGTYDPENQFAYTLVGADFYARLGRFDLRGEYLIRRTEMSLGDDPDARFKYGPGDNGEYDDFFLKHGFYVETNLPLGIIELVGRFDGLMRDGNVVRTSQLRSESAVLRYSAGFNLLFERSLRFKLMGEIYDFSDFDDEVAVTGALVAVF